MDIVCLDMEGVLIPEIWIAVADATNIPDLKRTTRDEPNYDKLMRFRLDLLDEHNINIHKIQQVVSTMEPLDGAKDFLDRLREVAQVIIISDTFTQFAAPILKKLGYPTLFCNDLTIDKNGKILDYKMRTGNTHHTKLSTVKALQSIGFETIAAGDSLNDIEMIRASKAGFLFRSTSKIKADNPDITALESYDDLLRAITGAMG